MGKESPYNLIIGGVIVGLIILIVTQYYTTPEPEPFTHASRYGSMKCYPNSFSVGEDLTYEITLENTGKTNLFSQFCFYGNNITLIIGNSSFNEKVCYPEYKIRPGYHIDFKPIIFINESEAPDILILKTEASCSYKKCNHYQENVMMMYLIVSIRKYIQEINIFIHL